MTKHQKQLQEIRARIKALDDAVVAMLIDGGAPSIAPLFSQPDLPIPKPENAIDQRIAQMTIHRPMAKPAKARTHWTKDDEATVWTLYSNGKSYDQIGAELHRSAKAISMRIGEIRQRQNKSA